MKPLAVYDYTQQMAGVDKNDQFNTTIHQGEL